MGRSRARCVVIHIVLLTWMTTAVGTVEGRVLCFGSDGHVAIEADAGDGSCGSAAFRAAAGASVARPGGASPGWEEDHCGPCTDFSLTPGEAVRIVPQGSPSAGGTTLLPVLSKARTILSTEGRAIAAGDEGVCALDPIVVSLRATRLLI